MFYHMLYFLKKGVAMNQCERRLFLIQSLLKEKGEFSDFRIPEGKEEQRLLLRALMNVRLPGEVSQKFLKIQDEYLQEELARKGIFDSDDLSPLQPGLYLWQGDITTLRCDAIVNAANSGLTGCYIPNHRCIDNAIHTYSGVQLRLYCDRMIKSQGYYEPTGRAKITPAFNLPCKYVLHTVGPIVYGSVTKQDVNLLRSCYLSCLKLAAEQDLKSIAFCCISTGEFHFPNQLAARIAVETAKEFLRTQSSIRKVIFNVFKENDRIIYDELLGKNQLS